MTTRADESTGSTEELAASPNKSLRSRFMRSSSARLLLSSGLLSSWLGLLLTGLVPPLLAHLLLVAALLVFPWRQASQPS